MCRNLTSQLCPVGAEFKTCLLQMTSSLKNHPPTLILLPGPLRSQTLPLSSDEGVIFEKPGLGCSKDMVQISSMLFPCCVCVLGQRSQHPGSPPTLSVMRADDVFLTSYPKDQLNDVKAPGRTLGCFDFQSDWTKKHLGNW